MILLLGVIALVLALADEIIAGGRSLTGWAAACLALAVIVMAGGLRVL